jgi:serine/threonine protein kinase
MHEDSQQAHQARLPGSSGNHALSAGTRIDNAEITGQIGSSPAAIVYLAREAATNRRIAVREYMPHGLASRSTDGGVHPSGNAEEAVYAAGLRSFINEALVLSRLTVPSLLSFERYIELNGTAYAFMPYHEGSTLDYAVTEENFAPDEVWIRMLVMRLLDAAEAVQRAQSCHGNIRPGNILVRRDGTPLLLEFDAAQATIGEIIHTPTGMLATGYAAMEQHFNARDRNIGAWTDIYGIGATAYFLVTGHPPPYAMQRMANEGMLPALHAARGNYSRGLLSAIGRALAIHPEHRFQTAAEMRAALSSEPQIVMPASPSVLRSDNARAAAQANRETTPAAANASLHQRQHGADVQPTQINPAAARAELPPLSQIQAHSLPALSDDWRKPLGDHGYRGGHSGKRRRSGLWVSSLVLLAGVSVGLGAGYMHLVADGDSPQAEAAAGKPQDAVAAPDNETRLAAAAPTAATAKATPASVMPPPSVVARPAAGAAAAPAPAAAAKQNAPAAVPTTAAKTPPPSTSPAGASEADKEAARLAAQEQEQWRIASYVDQAVSYETYLKRYPGGRYAASAREKIASLQRPAATADTPERAAPAVAASAAPSTVIASAATTASAASAASAARADRADARPSADEDNDPPSAPAPVASNGNARVIRLDGQTMTGSFTPDPSTGAVSGTGRIEWSNGDRFDGTLVRGSKEGKGQFVWRSGQRYSGDWAGNEPNGKGTIVFANGNRYDGEVRNGIPNGKGKLVFADKTRYEGDVRGGVPNGKGAMTFPDGTRYEGDVRNGVPHGQGVTRFKNGDVYVGAVAQGRSNGHGRFSWSNGTAWEGEFRDGQRTENGRMLTAMSRAAMSSGGSPGGTSDGGFAGSGRDEIVTK